MFWEKYTELCEKNNIRPRKLAAELGMSPAGVTRWVHGSVPNRETLEQIAAKFGVTTDYLISDEEFFITSAEKRSTFKKLTALLLCHAGLYRSDTQGGACRVKTARRNGSTFNKTCLC